jgi:hypothetical protein
MSVDGGLLAIASDVLRQNEFSVMSEHLHGADTGWVLAENDLFIVAVAAGPDLDELRRVESFAAPELIERLSQSEGVGGKRWDAYLVLIASSTIDAPDDAKELVAIEYNTRGVRRLVAVGVEPTEEDVRRVLRPFMPLPPPLPGGLSDAFQDLSEQLVLNGVESEDAHRTVAAFQDRGHLNDV